MKSLLNYRNLIVVLFTVIFALTFHGVSDALTYTHIYVDAVNGVNAPAGRGSAVSPYKSITFALLISERNNLPDPWHVHIHPGNYNGDAAKGTAREIFPLKLRQEMIFEGTTTAAECIIDGQHTGEATVPLLLGENTEGVTIRNLTVQNSLRTKGTGGIVLHDPTGTKETPSTFEGCVVHNNKGGGVWSNMPLILTGNTFSNNHWTGVETTKSAAATNNIFSGNHWTGLYLSGNSTGDISENVFRNNRSGRRDAAGLHIKDTLEGNITHNTFEGNEANSGPNGFSVIVLTGNVTHNTFKNVDKETGPAFRVHTLTGSIAHNVFIGKSSHAANGFGANILTGDVTRNEFNGMTVGFEVSSELIGNVTYNKFIRNKQGFHISNRFTGNMITHNVFDSNSSSTHWAGGFHLRLSKDTVEVSNNIFFNNTGHNANSVHIAGATVHFMNHPFLMSHPTSDREPP
ncbi:MAG: right-handed parallel beta-helix repeat-containing protein, partial [Candidatus Poribacteria bacterium]|nr:right-handed parallel beta-helix repeat-containing protein [Candidatus Poribacteria bacterium]